MFILTYVTYIMYLYIIYNYIIIIIYIKNGYKSLYGEKLNIYSYIKYISL